MGPPGLQSELAIHFRIHGWRWDDTLLVDVLGHLADEDVRCISELRGVVVDEIDAAPCWPADVRVFVDKMCKAKLPAPRTGISCGDMCTAGQTAN